MRKKGENPLEELTLELMIVCRLGTFKCQFLCDGRSSHILRIKLEIICCLLSTRPLNCGWCVDDTTCFILSVDVSSFISEFTFLRPLSVTRTAGESKKGTKDSRMVSETPRLVLSKTGLRIVNPVAASTRVQIATCPSFYFGMSTRSK